VLVLSRRRYESVVVGGSNGIDQMLKVTVLGMSGGRVRLGFEIADEFPVHRFEVWEQLHTGGVSDAREPPVAFDVANAHEPGVHAK